MSIGNVNFYVVNKEIVGIGIKTELEIYKKDYAKLVADIVKINSELEEYKSTSRLYYREHQKLLSVIRSLKSCKTKRQVDMVIKDY